MNAFVRPTFDPAGRVIARRTLPIGDRKYEPGQELSAQDRAEIAARLPTLWQLGVIDTPATEPSDAELERLTAPSRSAQQAKQQPRR